MHLARAVAAIMARSTWPPSNPDDPGTFFAGFPQGPGQPDRLSGQLRLRPGREPVAGDRRHPAAGHQQRPAGHAGGRLRARPSAEVRHRPGGGRDLRAAADPRLDPAVHRGAAPRRGRHPGRADQHLARRPPAPPRRGVHLANRTGRPHHRQVAARRAAPWTLAALLWRALARRSREADVVAVVERAARARGRQDGPRRWARGLGAAWRAAHTGHRVVVPERGGQPSGAAGSCKVGLGLARNTDAG